jgi:hypothetical protein
MNTPTPPQVRRPVPVPFGEEPTRQVDDDLLTALRNAAPAKPSPKLSPAQPVQPRTSQAHPAQPRTSQTHPAQPRTSQAHAAHPRPSLPRPSAVRPAHHDEPTRLASMEAFNRGFEDPGGDELTRPVDDFQHKFLATPPATDPNLAHIEDHRDGDEATRISSLDGMAAMERARSTHGLSNDERTRAVNIRNDPSISDIDWDLDS